MTAATISRSSGIGGSDIGCIAGLHPSRTAFDVYAEKVGLVQFEATPRMRMGKKLERLIAELYSEETDRCVSWSDSLHVHPHRTWQLATPDAFAEGPRGLDCKNVAIDQLCHWGDAETDAVPPWIAAQCLWYLDVFPECEAWDVAALFGGNDLQIFTVQPHAEMQDRLREIGERFWRDHVLPQKPPPLDGGWASDRYLADRFPQNSGRVRKATEAETKLLLDLKNRDAEKNKAIKGYEEVEAQVKEKIGEDDGIEADGNRVTWRKAKDTYGTDWCAIAHELAGGHVDQTVIEQHQAVTRKGTRRIHKVFA